MTKTRQAIIEIIEPYIKTEIEIITRDQAIAIRENELEDFINNLLDNE